MSQYKTNRFGVQKKLWCALLVSALLPFATVIALTGWSFLTTTAGFIALVVLAVSLLIGSKICSGFLRQARALDHALQQITNGNFESRVDILSQDEMGHAAELLNVMCDNTLNLVQSRNENADVQRSIENLLPQLRTIADGDLTVSAEIKSDGTGEIAKSFNRISDQTLSLVLRLQLATEQVDQSVTSIQRFSSATTQDGKRTANEINDASKKLMDMTRAFQAVAMQAAESVNVAVEARQTAADGLKAVNDTVQGMQRIRAQVKNTSQRIKRLGESSQEIGEIVQLISDITDRTSILALNASIQAAMAGDAGHGFAVVAEEVERLAERSASATGQVARLIRGIQRETKEVMSDMEESTREVVDGSRLATEAGETLFEIDSVSNQLVVMIEDVSESANLQAQNVNGVASSMQQICNETTTSVENTRSASQALEQLEQMTDEIRTTLTRFQVPAQKNQTAVKGIESRVLPTLSTEEDEDLFAEQLREFSRMLELEARDQKSPANNAAAPIDLVNASPQPMMPDSN
ncbi:MAG: HAMP domain-containing methyl-accepting chemotaxis protein [Pirellulaceae bacterium]|nr:HAMP domain-containing methyl-accepting chemotaxis protein [Pirellulaceae bacterium]